MAEKQGNLPEHRLGLARGQLLEDGLCFVRVTVPRQNVSEQQRR